MQICVLGTGMVGQTLGNALLHRDHEVAMGSRTADNAGARAWADAGGDRARSGTYAEAVEGAELVVNATAGSASLDVLAGLDAAELDGAVVLDVANPLDFSAGMPPVLGVSGRDSLAEQLQRAQPAARVVKSLNTMTAAVMVQPSLVPGRHTVFVSGDDADAKALVTGVLTSFGWPPDDVLDLGALETARGTEALLPLWLRLWGTLGTSTFNVAVVR